jgi:hypothetical protein
LVTGVVVAAGLEGATGAAGLEEAVQAWMKLLRDALAHAGRGQGAEAPPWMDAK